MSMPISVHLTAYRSTTTASVEALERLGWDDRVVDDLYAGFAASIAAAHEADIEHLTASIAARDGFARDAADGAAALCAEEAGEVDGDGVLAAAASGASVAGVGADRYSRNG
jgi:hypothetical protein